MTTTDDFGTAPMGKLLRSQAVPAAIGILILSIYGIVDTIYVGRWVGALGIAAITVVMPITFLIASIGMSIGVGGASIISRALGSGNPQKAFDTFGNQIALTITLSSAIVGLGFIFTDEILLAFGGQGEILAPAKSYFRIVLLGVPFLAWAMMSNNDIRAVGFPKVAMFILVVPAVANIILDPILIIWLDMGLEGAAWGDDALLCGQRGLCRLVFCFWKIRIKGNARRIVAQAPDRQGDLRHRLCHPGPPGTISLLSIVLNNSLFIYGGEMAVGIYGIINRLMMFVNFPVLGITQGVVPIMGFNYGAQLWDRVKSAIKLSITSATLIAFSIFVMILLFAPYLVAVFTTDETLIAEGTPAMRIAFLATPLIAINLIGSAYFQAIGKALPALLLALTKQGFFLIPLLLILPPFFGLNGVWMSFPIADIGAALITYWYLRRATRELS